MKAWFQAAVLLCGCCLLPAACSAGAVTDNFSQYPGFADYFAAHPRGTAAANAEQQSLLQAFAPRLYVAADAEGPLSFYEDYIAHGRLQTAQGSEQSVTAARLNAVRDDPGASFTHLPAPGPVHPLVFARVDAEPIPGVGDCLFLSYHAVFRHSGLPADIGFWFEHLAALVGDVDDWHQLDHYTAVTVVLGPGARPLGYFLQQHNYLRSFVAGDDFDWPPDQRLRIVSARRSNELYPWRAETTRWRAGSFLDPATTQFLVAAKPVPRMAAFDVAEPGREVNYRLAFLPKDDAFYSFAGFLGERRRLPGRDGPPGADYNALPIHKSRALQFALFHWREDDAEQAQQMLAALAAPAPELAARMAPLYGRLQQSIARGLHAPQPKDASFRTGPIGPQPIPPHPAIEPTP